MLKRVHAIALRINTAIVWRLLLSTSLLLLQIPNALGSDPAVRVRNQPYAGVPLGAADGMIVFRGIPYAQPPIGNLRWVAPQALANKQHDDGKDLIRADTFAPRCPQDDGNIIWYRRVAAAFGDADASSVGPGPMSEDCLYLNIWTSSLDRTEKLAVMVWIHGGSNRTGWSFEPNYLGHNLASKGVVVVSINYRLGAFGFLAHPLLSRESSAGVSGNYGLLDQIAALKWIRENIAQFGGDADNITLFGESAGAANISYLILSPMAKGLFHKAISQSGGYPVNSTRTIQQGEQTGNKLAEALHIPADGNTLRAMREKSVAEIIAAVSASNLQQDIEPVIDGKILPDRPARLFMRGEFNATDLIIGTNSNEWYMYVDESITKQKYLEDLSQNFGDFRTELQKILDADNPRLAMDKLYTSSKMLCTSMFIASRMTLKTPRVYAYQFSRLRPGVGGEKLLSYHGAEIPYVFDTHDDWLPTEETDRFLTDAMGTFWTQFAKTGNPNAAGLPYWPNYGNSRNYVVLGDRIFAAQNPEREICAIMEKRLQLNVIE
ncbi:MAG: carboxylesterase family protein [Gammaproteobacteria bacterium]|nr:carboxylesterase family protein [Gammaproteobacteria bacterium]